MKKILTILLVCALCCAGSIQSFADDAGVDSAADSKNTYKRKNLESVQVDPNTNNVYDDGDLFATVTTNKNNIAKSQPVSLNNAPKVSYVHYFETLDELWEISELCVIGTVKKSEDSTLAVNHELENIKVINSRIGELDPEMIVSTFGNYASLPEEVQLLNVGDTYLFFLNKAYPDDDISKVYSAVGAYQGVYEVTPSKSGKLADYTFKQFNDKNAVEKNIIGKKLSESLGDILNESSNLSGRVRGVNVSLRKDADPKSKKLASLKDNTTVDILQKLDGWYQVQVDGVEGFIQSKFVIESK